jgi:hypothetical protein
MVMENWNEELIKALQLNGKAERSQANYIRTVRILTEHCDRPPILSPKESFRSIFSIAEMSANGHPTP